MQKRLVFEIGGTKLQAGAGTTDGKLIATRRCPVAPAEPTELTCRHLAEMAAELLAQVGPVESLGIGFGGPVDTRAGKVVLSHHVPGWSGFPLVEWAGRTFHLPCVIENDTNAGALAEAAVGAGRGAGVVFYTNIGSGIGGGLVIDGKLYSRRFGACEVGHTKLYDRRSQQYVIVEQLCSGWAIDRLARQRASAGELARVLELASGQAEAVTAAHVGQAAREGDAAATALVGQVAEDFSIALCNVIAMLNPDRIIIGGGVSLMGEVFFAPLRQAVAKRVFDIYADNYKILPAGLGEQVVLVGALLI